jgi:site-specific recombinase XerD
MQKLPPVSQSSARLQTADFSRSRQKPSDYNANLRLLPRAEPFSPAPPAPSLSLEEVDRYASDYLFDCEYRQHSERTLREKKICLDKLRWFLRVKGCTECGTGELRRFLAYATNGHLEPGGRWGNPRMTRPIRPITVRGYYRYLQSLFNWLVAEGLIESSPMARVSPPVVRQDHIQPFSKEQVELLITTTRRTKHVARNEAMVRFLYDTGMRAQEFCEVKVGQVDLLGRSVQIARGKGNKKRVVFFSMKTARALRRYLAQEPRLPDEPLFQSERGRGAGQAMTRSGLLQQIERLGLMAGLQGVRCSPHTFRHTMAIDFLRAGGDVFTLKQLLGHASLQMTMRYVSYAQADIEAQYRKCSLGDRLSV